MPPISGGMRSYSGCLTCKRRKLKCDESKPSCGNCIKASRECAYGNQSIFRSQEIGSSTRKRKYRSKKKEQHNPEPSPGGDNTWVEVPSDLTFVHVEDPLNTESSRLIQNDETTLDQESRDGYMSPGTVRENEVFRSHETPVTRGHSYAETPSMHLSPLTGREGPSPFSTQPPGDIPGTEKVMISHLLRHFKQGPGQWMDLFDTTAYFSSKVPVLAASKPLLRSAVCALSAKHLRHLSLTNNQNNGNADSPMSVRWGTEETWKYNSAVHYDQALSYLKNIVSRESYLDNLPDKEEMLAAVAILCAFELMDAPGSAWRAHLSALPLFHDDSPSVAEHPSIVIPHTAVKGPIFWSLARQDLLCAFISESQTRLDLKDMRLWQNAGLATDSNGDILPYSPLDIIETQNSSGIEEDKKSNELTWILGKIANHLTAGDALAAEDNSLPPEQRLSIGLTQQHLLERWNMLMNDLEKWHDSLPPSFTPTARTQKFGPVGPGYEQSFNTFEQIWFDLPLAAATIQSYHQAKVLLMANEPQESTALRSTVSARLRSYRHALLEVIYHAREICGISLANTTDAFRVNSVQALFVAGQVFEDQSEQDGVLELLAGVERDIGWTTKFHITKLKDEWLKGREGNHAERDERRPDFHWSTIM